MTKMKFLRAYRNYRAGQVVDVPGGMVPELASRRIAVVDSQGALIETAAIDSQAETADATPKRRRNAVPQPDTPDAAQRRARKPG